MRFSTFAGSAALTSLTALATPAAAQHVAQCDWQADARGIVEPWEDYTRSFANGAVRVALLDTVEPAAGALHILVLTPPYDDKTGDRTCAVVGWSEGIGFATVNFTEMAPAYDPSVGLVLAMGARFFDPELDFSNIGVLYVGINQSTGNVTASYEITGQD